MSIPEDIRIEEKWLHEKPLQKLFDILTGNGGEARVAGGAVRNTLMGEIADDIDLCTTLLPEEVVERIEAAKERAVPTGMDHGTVTAVIDGKAFEVTTLREDVETDGRHAVVRFGKDWERDALRRDLTINALYCDREGRVYDPVGGYADILAREVRFIGDAQTRIREDALRILRFFRFFAWYGDGRPDAGGLKACAANKDLLKSLSAERVWMELKKLLRAIDPSRALLWMRTTGVSAAILPESGKWGMDAIPGLIAHERETNLEPDAMLRLMAMIRPDPEVVLAIADRLSFSNAETERLKSWASSSAPKPDISTAELGKLLYRGSQQGMLDAMRLEAVHWKDRGDEKAANAMTMLATYAQGWAKPVFPVRGRDLKERGMEDGPEMGVHLARLEEAWIESGFALTSDALVGML